ncbi:MAG: hypothetical protein LWW97_08955 [Deltaproteobacteria bacterium]|nr:hypothetical protein [Deltaproteobacteria bacterium]
MAGGKEEFEALGGKKLAYDYELRYLPPYCRCRAALNADKYKHERKKWDPIFARQGEKGKDWMHLHHYCYGLIMLNRHSRGVGKPSALLREAEAQINYVITHSNPKFILMPELHLKMGITQKLMGKDSKALQHFIQAIKLKKNYVPAYLHIISYYKEHHDLKNAIKTAKRGLKYSPKSNMLKKKLIEMQSLSTTK